MVHKSEDGHPALPDKTSAVASLASDEFEDAVTSEIVAITVEPVGKDHESMDVTDASAPIEDGPAPVQPTDDEALEPGFLLKDRFEIVQLVHSGGMSHVYKAVDNRRHLDGPELIHVAIKMMRRSVATGVNARLALEREAAKAQRLSHPNIINIYDFDEHNGQFFLVMEWLEGETVNALLRRTSGRRLEPQFAWRVIRSIAAAVQHAHFNNVVHADINPSNIFITDTQDIKLLDFGVARYCGDQVDAADVRPVWATRTYASPELLSGSTPVFEDDVFSLGCVAYRLLGGTHPFAGLSSIEAKQADLSIPPIAGLAETESQTLSRALSYLRSDRPGTADVFSTESAAASESVATNWQHVRPSAYWLGAVPLAAIIILAGTWWLWQSSSETEESTIAGTALVDDQSTVAVDATSATSEPTELDRLLSSAATAMDEERFLTPVDNNARDLYREALVIDSVNPIALGGLRAISDMYVQHADTQLRAGAPELASADLAIAAETDPGNPAIAIVNELLVAQGDRQLAEARLAAAEGDFERSAELLAEAENYAHVDINAINVIRDQIAQYTQERQFLRQLEAANDQIAAGNLMTPTGNNAFASLIELQQDYAADSRLLASMERLGERLLTRAAFATSADRFPEAADLLDAVAALDVLTPELAAARASLLRAEEEAKNAMIAASALANSAPEESASPPSRSGVEPEQTAAPTFAVGGMAPLPSASNEESAIPPSRSDVEPEQTAAPTLAVGGLAPLPSAGSEESAIPPSRPDVEPAQTAATTLAVAGLDALPTASSDVSGLARDAVADSGTTLTGESSEPRKMELSDMGIEKYIAPQFPRSARRRGLSGFVDVGFSVYPDGSTGAIEILNSEPGDVFDSNVEYAVSKWRFAPRDDEFRAQVTLRFEQ